MYRPRLVLSNFISEKVEFKRGFTESLYRLGFEAWA